MLRGEGGPDARGRMRVHTVLVRKAEEPPEIVEAAARTNGRRKGNGSQRDVPAETNEDGDTE
ncbi:Uncharacterised protein [Mycobacteroides abscessus subsp. abscessus]|nr:Uncharacterised protein [Mycobacteroides abscessus subsp. abscessus]